MPLYVTNATDKTIYLKSFDGDSVAIHAKSHKMKVAYKFNWQIPEMRGLRVVDAGEDTIDACKIVRPRGAPPVAKRPQGHHNKSRSEPMPFATSAAYYDRMGQLDPKKGEQLTKARSAIEARFARSGDASGK